ncbi:FadR/GntR family transcriptional regulator [Microbispora sp. NPDC049125]|uniref:FadR/GntR family transcriptional regulator n=1 Tax=Microbispora sp. NPDC049125 TaxID=3154929 RepID=UPI0034654D47
MTADDRPGPGALTPPRGTRTRAFEEVLARIEERIEADGLTVGDRLPGERRLAEELQVGRSSIREALRVLETLGVVSSQAGRGPDAGAVLISRPGSALTGLLRLHLGLATLSMREVMDTRLMIEQWSAGQAARSGTGLEGMARALAAMDGAAGPDEFVEHDIAFHMAIAEASGNRLTAAIMQALRDVLHRFAVDAVVRLGDTTALQADHRRVYEAVREGDADAAAAAIAGHLDRVYPPL